jgi:hypothetical protein
MKTLEASAGVLNKHNYHSKIRNGSKLIPVSSPSLTDSRYVVVESNVGYISRTVSVTSLVDSAPDVSLCNLTSPDQQLFSSLSVTSGECNFRSAVETCSLFLSTESCEDTSATACVVLLPPMETIIMDPVLGEVNITDGSLCGLLSVEGSGCVILPSSSTSLSMRLLNVDLPVPSDVLFSLNINNVTIMNFGDSTVEGGAVRLNNFKSSITSSITNVIFRNNSGSDGGALAISNSETVVLGGNVFDGNTARGDAGGLLINSDCENINIIDCSFNYNTAMGEVNSKPGSAGLGGGAMINTRNSLVSLTNCSFFNNNALRAGGLGVYEANSDIYLTDVSFLNNTAERFGGSSMFHVPL